MPRADEILLTRYLLGQLTEAEQAQVEDRAFADPDYLDLVRAAEADLIDTYVQGQLSASDRRAFEVRFLTSPQRRNKVDFARALATVSARPVRMSSPAPWQWWMRLLRECTTAPRFAAALATLICAAGLAWLLQARHENSTQDLRRQLAEARQRATKQQQQAAAPVRTPLIASLTFPTGLARSADSVRQVALGTSVQIVRLEVQLDAADDFPLYRAEIRTRSGQAILVQSNLRRLKSGMGYGVSFDVPSSALTSGDYELALQGIASDGSAQDLAYGYFRVRRL